ncbi:MAG TPA: phosphoribosylamine--glycine ligase [Gemmatimonadaceae bacterium]|nr:phosphoribosylamine--glycine ligase [Gemmatimonadaceae bacterium]
MKLLIVGGGGREHALAWKLKQDDPTAELIAAPGNPGIASLGRTVSVPANDVDGLVRLAESERVAVTVVGPEAPLAAGVVDRFRERGLAVFGPTRAAAQIETSKRYAKELMAQAGVPTARAFAHSAVEGARRAVRELGAPVVVKASGLASGKGVIVCQTVAEADAAIDRMLVQRAFGTAGTEILVEEFIEGEELSLFAVTDGQSVLTMLPAQDHKRLLDGDRGPNTGGMGAYAPVSIGTPELVEHACARIIQPTLDAMREQGAPFTGLLYAGLMLTADGPKVVEFNCRFGDPETEAILPLLSSSLLEPVVTVATGGRLSDARPFEWSGRHAVTTVVAAAGYPDSPRAGDVIALAPEEADVHVFHAGTSLSRDGRLVTSGGRVFAVTGVGSTFAEARARSASAAARVAFQGRQSRGDIGWREARRQAAQQVDAGAT